MAQKLKSRVSAPGKVLLTGGYLILEQPNAGIVVSTTARFHSTTQWENIGDEKSAFEPLEIFVESPQFHARYRYTCTWPVLGGLPKLTPWEGQAGNDYVEYTLRYTLAFLEYFRQMHTSPDLKGSITIVLEADNDFYSQITALSERKLPTTVEALVSLPNFLPCPIVNGLVKVSKTGMGSSAALITSLVGSLLASYGVIELPTPKDAHSQAVVNKDSLNESMRLTYRLSQICHSAAQGKIGSGFDVSSAVYGTHIYTRFSPFLISSVLEADALDEKASKRLYEVVKEMQWDCKRDELKLPSCFRLLMGDVQGGSSTTSMVKGVMKWRLDSSTQQEAFEIWNKLAAVNNNIKHMLLSLDDSSRSQRTEFEEICRLLAELTPDYWADSKFESLLKLRNEFMLARSLLREMGRSSGVQIEPLQQTQLADVTSSLPGVLCSGVPGAGGVDAIFAIVVHPSAVTAVQNLWSNWHLQTADQRCIVCPLLLRNEPGGEYGDGIVCQYVSP